MREFENHESIPQETRSEIPERVLQRAVRQLLRNPSRVWTTTRGERLQVLAPGRVNVHEGPDFLDMAVLLGASVTIGAAEFHRRAADWTAHNHQDNPLYEHIILHIVCECDKDVASEIPTLVVDMREVRSVLAQHTECEDDTAADEVQGYALMRLMRRISEHTELMKTRTVGEVFQWSVFVFLMRYARKRHRPRPNSSLMPDMQESLALSVHQRFVTALADGVQLNIAECLCVLQQTAIENEGWILRGELITNCILPCALAVASDDARIGLFEWYWSCESQQSYGGLRRMFRAQSQRYVWQQQGLLEMAREKRADTRVHEVRILYEVMKRVGCAVREYRGTA